jgi:hypothetical protein
LDAVKVFVDGDQTVSKLRPSELSAHARDSAGLLQAAAGIRFLPVCTFLRPQASTAWSIAGVHAVPDAAVVPAQRARVSRRRFGS